MSAPTRTAAVATTPTLRASSRRAVFWIVIAVIALAAASIAVIVNQTGSSAGPALGAHNPAPAGGMAVANVLKAQGVSVITADSASQARKAVASGHDATLLVYDENGYLDEQHLSKLNGIAATTVLIRPNFQALRTLAPAVEAAGAPRHPHAVLQAQCSVPAAVKAGRISAPQSTYRLDNDSYTGCFPASKHAFAMAAYNDGASELYVVGSTKVFDNENVIHDGNAALALNLLGEHDTLVWYLPTFDDVSVTGPPSLGDLTPGWVTPVVLLLIAAVIAAAVWRGRRFGPLVVENLPVIVRAEETMEGRARLYQRSSARGHAIDALRIGAVGRIAVRCGLPSTAQADEVAAAASAVLGANSYSANSYGGDPYAVRGILLDAPVNTDADLMRLSAQLEELERAVAAATDAT
jgi:uncharacterized protein DUF4350